MLRVITGTVKGKKLLVADSSRPITDRIRTSIFDTIKDFVQEAKILDLYAGSGSFSIEGLSRGAKNTELIENNAEAIDMIRSNLQNTGFSNKALIHVANVKTFLTQPQKMKYDLIMLDPPFAVKPEDKLQILELTIKLLSKEGIIIFRFPTKEIYPATFGECTEVYKKKYGISTVSYYKKQLSVLK